MNEENSQPVSTPRLQLQGQSWPNPGQPVASGLWKLKQQVDREANTCWLLVAVAAIASWPVGTLLGYLATGIVSLFSASYFDSVTNSSTFGTLAGLVGTMTALASAIIGLLIPAAVIFWAIREYRSNYRFAAGDLVWNDIALFLLHEEYGAMIEQSRHEHYRPNLHAVELGETLSQRLQHFAAYYRQYRRLARPSGELRVPVVLARNCWIEGSLLLAGCCTTYLCVGLFLLLPVIIHVLGSWPRQVAIKRAVVHFFEGRFDHQFPPQL